MSERKPAAEPRTEPRTEPQAELRTEPRTEPQAELRMDLEFDHLGLATKNMERARKLFSSLGYAVSDVVGVPVQTVNVCFAQRAGHPTIELIEPAGDGSPIEKILERVGSGPYHLCYRTGDLAAAARELRARGFIPLGPEFVSGPLGEQRTGFFHNASVGMIEVTEHRR